MSTRQVTTAVTLLVLCGIVVAGAFIGWQKLFAELPDDELSATTPPPNCSSENVQKGQRLRARQVRVSVFNAGSRAGLADSTLDAMQDRGFEAGEVGNAPDDVQVRRVQVWSTQADDAEARLVALQFGKGTEVTVTDVDLGPGVNIVVGNDLEGLERAKRSIRIQEPQEVCVPSNAEDGANGTG